MKINFFSAHKRLGFFLTAIVLFHAVQESSGRKMLELSAAICLLAASAVVSSDYYANPKVFHFTRDQSESNGFNFEYTLANGEKFIGKATPLHSRSTNIYVMMGADDSFYWVNFSEDDLKKDSFDKSANYVHLDRGNKILANLMDDFVSYDIYRNGILIGGPYATYWDVNKVAFQRADTKSKTFNYVISSSNNGRQYRNITSYTADPHIQTINVPDYHECFLFQATFTDEELNSSQTIHKQLDQSTVCEPPPAGVPPGCFNGDRSKSSQKLDWVD
ncbi:uncharacterized protein LOC129565575 [Sitodiplosis mosellana]|uniref:uncharacterized protein LOC129565575 n=1 Tax=Sitodiplosis mosellana TaxID=263140 RepID=UPI002443BBEB|nr:uncharacterized protein LOC129565575 [Sitodiplosis mosellana]